MGSSPEGFPEFFPFTSCVGRTKAPFSDESPALTAVLQAQPRELYQSHRISHSPPRAGSCEPPPMRQTNPCRQCGNPLTGRQRLFCSRACKNRSTNTRHQIYAAQKQRGVLRKVRLVAMLGGACAHCGYAANFAALEFHHASGRKDFQLDMRSLANRSWDLVLQEARKCELLCSNCHAETHRPDLGADRIHLLIPAGSAGS